METPSNGLWVTAFISRVTNSIGSGPIVASIVTIGMVPVCISTLYFALTWGEWTMTFLISHALATLVVVIAPPAIYYWETVVFSRFVRETEPIIDEPEQFQEIVERYRNVFKRRYWVTSGIWAALVVGVIALNIGFFRTVGVSGFADPALWVYLAFGAWFGLITGIGFHGAFVTVLCIREMGELGFEIEPLHPDGVGGLRSIGSFAIWTTMLISIGSLTLPLAFLMAAAGGFTPLVYLAVAAYTLTIFVSFIYPTTHVYRKAKRIRAEELEQRRSQIRGLQADTAELLEEDIPEQLQDMREATKRLEIQHLREEYNEYRNVSLYPLSSDILVRLFSSVLLPMVFLGLRLFIVR